MENKLLTRILGFHLRAEMSINVFTIFTLKTAIQGFHHIKSLLANRFLLHLRELIKLLFFFLPIMHYTCFKTTAVHFLSLSSPMSCLHRVLVPYLSLRCKQLNIRLAGSLSLLSLGQKHYASLSAKYLPYWGPIPAGGVIVLMLKGIYGYL